MNIQYIHCILKRLYLDYAIIAKDHPSAAVQISSSESPQHPDLLVSGTNLRNSCLVKMLGDKWASHSLSRRKPPHKKFFFPPYPPGHGLLPSTRCIWPTKRRRETSQQHPGCFRTLIAWFPQLWWWKVRCKHRRLEASDLSHKLPRQSTACSLLATRPGLRPPIGWPSVTQTSPNIPFPSRGWDN